MADNLAKDLCKRGQVCFEPLLKLLGENAVGADGEIDKAFMAKAIFESETVRQKVNGIIHPSVKQYILELISKMKKENKYDYFFLEAALLIEDGYKEIVDELWYIYTDEQTRRERLKISRGYSDSKIDSILESQLSDSEFRSNSDFVIDNSGTEEASFIQIRERLIQYGSDAE